MAKTTIIATLAAPHQRRRSSRSPEARSRAPLHLRITTVHRSDGSGTTFNFTDYLSSVSPQWKSAVGSSTQVSFPTGLGAKGSSGVAGIVGRANGAIGYVDAAYAITSHVDYAAVRNRAGRFELPTLAGVKAAAASLGAVPSDNAVSIVNPPASAGGA